MKMLQFLLLRGDLHHRASGEYHGALVRHDTSLHLQRFRGPAVGLCLGVELPGTVKVEKDDVNTVRYPWKLV